MKKMWFASLFVFLSFHSMSQEIPKWKMDDVEKYMKEGKGVLVINFWATFCKPCVAEIPSFIQLAEKYKQSDVKLLLVSVDLPALYPAKIKSFAKKKNFNANIVWLDETNADYFCPKLDSSWSGSIPATLMLNTQTGYRQFFEGEITPAEFEQGLKKVIASGSAKI